MPTNGKIRIMLDPGHDKTNKVNVGPTGYLEWLGAHNCATDVKSILQLLPNSPFEVELTTEGEPMTLQARSEKANAWNADALVSIHSNASDNKTASGNEVWYSHVGGTGKILAQNINTCVVKRAGVVNRGIKTRLGDDGHDYYGMIRMPKAPAVIAEQAFHTNPSDEQKLKTENVIGKYGAFAMAIAEGICLTFKVAFNPVFKPVNNNQNANQNSDKKPEPVEEVLTSIMGTCTDVTVDQAEAYLHAHNSNAPHYAEIYKECGIEEGVNWLVAFAQSILETGYFEFGKDVKASQNNFAGLGAVGAGASGASFSSPSAGILAQIQHLKAYASIEPCKEPIVDPRFSLVVRGWSPYVEWLGACENPKFKSQGIQRGWASPGINYGHNIVNVMNEIKATKVTTNTDYDLIMNFLNEANSIATNEKNVCLLYSIAWLQDMLRQKYYMGTKNDEAIKTFEEDITKAFSSEAFVEKVIKELKALGVIKA
jgi:N-acetylmuramoyl-L-alanine amidase